MTDPAPAVLQCPTEDALVAWFERGADAHDALGEHVTNCEHCRRDVSMLSASSQRVPQGLDRYVLQRILSQGGFGVVCEAWDELLQRPVAVKLTRAEHGTDALIGEAVAQASVAHPNVLGVLDAGVDGDTAFVVMERVEGSDADTASLAPAFDETDARAWVADVARGLAALHGRGLVHGDVSPRNILIGRDGTARLVDFGSCRPAVTGASATPGFVAPEGPGTAAADVFSLGATLGWLRTRAGVDADDPVVTRATASAPGRRYTATALARALKPGGPSAAWHALLVAVGVAFALFVRAWAPDVDVARADRLATQAREHLREGDLDEAIRVGDELRALADDTERDDVRTRALLLDANLADAQGHANEALALRRQASALAQGNVDAQARVESLAAQALDAPPEAATVMLDLAEGAAEKPDQHSFVAAVRAIVDASDPSIVLPDPAGPYAGVLRLAHTLRRMDAPNPDEPIPVDCAGMTKTFTRGVCFSVTAGVALQEENFDEAAAHATAAIADIESSERNTGCDAQLAYIIRGVARLDTDHRASAADLAHATTLCPDDPPHDLAVVRLMHARALLRLDRRGEADALVELARPYGENADVAEGLRVYADERAKP